MLWSPPCVPPPPPSCGSEQQVLRAGAAPQHDYAPGVEKGVVVSQPSLAAPGTAVTPAFETNYPGGGDKPGPAASLKRCLLPPWETGRRLREGGGRREAGQAQGPGGAGPSLARPPSTWGRGSLPALATGAWVASDQWPRGVPAAPEAPVCPPHTRSQLQAPAASRRSPGPHSGPSASA